MKKIRSSKQYFGLAYIATGRETNGAYFLSKTTIPAGDPGPPLHTHTKEDESFFILQGSLVFQVDGKEIELHRDEFLTIEKGEKHTWRNNTDQNTEMMVIFAPAGIENMFMELDEDMSMIKEIGLKYGTEFEL